MTKTRIMEALPLIAEAAMPARATQFLRPLSRRIWLMAVLAAFGTHHAPAASNAQDMPDDTLPDADARQIRRVIESQLEAFAADDAVQAFAMATPAIQAQVGSAEAFLQMVRRGYPAVYRARTRSYYRPRVIHGDVYQAVQVTDEGGQSWRALYQMERQADGHWRIAGCVLQEDEALST